jgi:hypothetical protein
MDDNLLKQKEARKLLRSIVKPEVSVHLSFDVDETIAGTFSTMIRFYNKQNGTNYTIADHKDWDFKSIGSDYASMMRLYVQTWRERTSEIPLIVDRNNVIEVVQYIVSDASTSRGGDEVTDGTDAHLREWLIWHKLAFMPIYCDKTSISKVDLQYEINIDDSPRFAEKVIKTQQGFLLLVDKPYNRHVPDNEHILKVSNADDAIGEIIDACQSVGRGKNYLQGEKGRDFLLAGDGKIPGWITGDVLREGLKQLDCEAIRHHAYSSKRLSVLRTIFQSNGASLENIRSESIMDEEMLDFVIRSLTNMRYIGSDANGVYHIIDPDIKSLIRERYVLAV